MIKSFNLQPPQLLSRYSTVFGGWPKPENLENHDFYEPHQKFSFSFPIRDMSGLRLSEVVRLTDIKFASIFITLQETFYLFTSDYSITCFIVPPVIQSLEESTQNLFLTLCDKPCLFVMPGVYI